MFSGSGLFVGMDVVGDGVDGQCFCVEFCCYVVDICCFYFYVQNVVFFYYVEYGWVWCIEQVCGEDVVDVCVNVQCFCCVYCIMYYVEIGNCCKIMVFEMQMVYFRVGVCVYVDYYVMQFDIFMYCVVGVYVDDFFYVEIGDQFFGVDRVGWDIYFVVYYGDFVVFIGIGEVQYVVYVVYFMYVFEEGFCNVFCVQWVVWY